MITAQAVMDLSALKENYLTLKQKSHSCKVVAVIKGDAYGHGAVKAAQALPMADAFAVSRLEEAIELRQAGIRQSILLLEGCFCQQDLVLAAELELDTVVHCPEQLNDLLSAKLVNPVKTWLKVDTGMHRLGVKPQEVADYVARMSASANIQGDVNFVSHFSSADDTSAITTSQQLAIFTEATRDYPGERSLANSAGILNWQESHFDWVRAGIALYGIAPDQGSVGRDYQLKPVMTLQSSLIAVREHQAGDPVGYSQTWTAEKSTRIGVVAMGYGDGYPRLAPSGTPVWINGREVPIVGRVSMDMITVDLGPDANDKVGDQVEFWGNNVPVERVAEKVGTIPYELTIKLTARVVKTYKG